MKRWLKWIGIGLALAIVVIVLFAAWLLETESGARFALERAKSALADKLSVENSRGALVSPLVLEGVHYRDAQSGIDVRIKSVKVDYALFGLFSRTLHIGDLAVDGIDVALTPVPATAPAAPAPSLQTLLTPPLAIMLDRAAITHIGIAQDGKPVFAADSIDLAATWTATALTIQKLALRAPDGHVDFAGGISSYANYQGSAKGSFDWTIGDRRASGTLDASNDRNTASIDLRLSQPLVATLNATLAARDDALPWTATLHVPRFDSRTLAGNDTLHSIALELSGSGDKTRGKVNANLELNTHHVSLDPLQYQLQGKTLTVDTVRIRSPEAQGMLTASGKAKLDANPVTADVDLAWNDVELPADLAGQTLATHGTLHAKGSTAKFDAAGEFAIGPPGKLSDISVAFAGTQKAIELQHLTLKQSQGNLAVSGNVQLQPQVQWTLQSSARHFDPGAFAKEWPGSIDMALSTNGKVEKSGMAGQVRLEKLSGTLRQRPISGQADLTFASPLALNGTLDLKSGNSSIGLKGKTADQADITANLSIASLGDWIPSANGSLRGTIGLKGKWPHLDAQANLTGSNIVSGELHAENVAINANVHDIKTPSGSLAVDAQNVSGGNYTFDSIKLDAHGDRAAHTVAIDARGPQLNASLAVNGSLTHSAKDETGWQGSLTTLSLAPKDAGAWKLVKPAPLSYGPDGARLGDLCFTAEASSVCATASQGADESLQAKFSIAHLQLKTIARFADPDAPLRLDGEIDGNGNFARTGNGALSGDADIHSASGSIAYPDSQMQPLISYKDFTVTAKLDAQHSRIDVRSAFGDGGRLDGHITIGAAEPHGAPLSGTIAASLDNLGFIDLLSSQTASTKGKVDAKITLSGTTSKPNASGDAALAGFATEIPAAGLKLHDGDIKLHSADGAAFAVSGSVASGDGKLTVSGSLGVDKTSPIELKLTGENFVAADIPGARVQISPDLTLSRKTGDIVLTGTMRVPKADVDVSKLPGGGIAQASPDVVVTDAERAPQQGSVPIVADITVKLGVGEKLDLDLRQGQEVHLVGFGLNGYLSGQIAVQDYPGRATVGRGQILVNGTYKAYGQDLTIQQGRLLFAGTPVDNPGLDLRATRAFTDPDVTVGLQVRGTAQVPILTVFSDPAMEQSDALSYLVAGKPLNQLKSGEGDAVGSAARALGTAGGDLLAKSIGRKIGFDDVGVADSTAVGGAALTIGKYLSPRLYLSYGVGLFTPGEVVTLRYRLTRLFNIEIQNGTLSSRAGINYRIEK
ncbi:MAG TPA: translocation/assembly module TamB domain-containing protein [Rudaea sp.]|jgi:translocation and assembly module TamB|nr:translocation/assembly module TamB domain-containing protein [Rudaea sp.]